ncbi:MAG: nitroreductase [Rhodobacteraceae bacterium]|nr:nitroreductase [Paracoccaceae bacterium]
MTSRNLEALEFLLTRRSQPYLTLAEPVPDTEQLMTLLTAAARSPDHGMLEPWRFIVIEKSAMARLGNILRRRGAELGKAPSLVEKAAQVFDNANLVVAVIASPNEEAKIPAIEQTLSAGAVCLSLLNAALASGWGATWLTGFGAHDEDFRRQALGIEPPEYVAGFIHIGTRRVVPSDRPRPNVNDLVSRLTN